MSLSIVTRLFRCISEARGSQKSRLIKKFLTMVFQLNRNPFFVFSVLRLIIPNEDKERGNYGLKEKALAKLLTSCMTLNRSEYDRLYHYKNPSYHTQGQAIGDFSICMFDVIHKYFKKTSSLTVNRLNELLDNLANTQDQNAVFTTLLK